MNIRYISYDKVIWILCVAFLSSIYILFESTFGSVIVLGLAILIFVLEGLKNGGQVTLSLGRYHFNVLLFALFCLASSIWAWDSSASFKMSMTIFQILICMALIYPTFAQADSIDGLLKVIMWTGYIVSVYSIFYYGQDIIGMLVGGVRLENAFNNVNILGMLAAMTIIITVYYLVNDGFKLRYCLAITAIIMLAATGSRKALIMVVLGIMAVLAFKNMNNTNFIKIVARIFITIIFVAILIYFLSKLSIFGGLITRMQGLLALISDDAKATAETPILRGLYIKIGLEQFKQTPILGIGISNSGILISQYFGYKTYLHNNFVELLACGGIVGFVIYYSMYMYIAVNILKRRPVWDKETPIVLTLILLLVLMDYGSVSYYSKTTYFFLMIGYIYVQILKRKESNDY